MKKWKLWLMNILGLAGLFTLVSVLVLNRSADAARMDLVPPISVQNLDNLQGQYLQVIYAVGRYPTIPTSLNQIQLIQIKALKTLPINSSTLELPQIVMEKNGLFPSYNVVLLVVTNQADFKWQNYDGSFVEGPTGSGSGQYLAVNLISRTDIESVIPRSDMGGVYRHLFH